MESKILTHLWQEQGLGTAPFNAVAIISLPSPSLASANPSAYNNAMVECCREASAFGVNLGCCNSCGQSLVNNVVIRDANRKYFVVGCDCAGKTHDSKLVSEVDHLEKQRKRAIKAAKAEAARKERQAQYAQRLQAERDRNGGLTDAEVRAKAEAERAEAMAAEMTEKNAWLIEALDKVPYASNFVDSIRADLHKKPISSFSDRCVDILAEIYAKTIGGRKGSRQYKDAYRDFCNKANLEY